MGLNDRLTGNRHQSVAPIKPRNHFNVYYLYVLWTECKVLSYLTIKTKHTQNVSCFLCRARSVCEKHSQNMTCVPKSSAPSVISFNFLIIWKSLRPSDAYMRQETNQHWFRLWLVAWTAPSHYLNQCWNIVNWTLKNKFQWNLNRNSYNFIQENASENVVWKMAAILSRPQCVKNSDTVDSIIANHLSALNTKMTEHSILKEMVCQQMWFPNGCRFR